MWAKLCLWNIRGRAQKYRAQGAFRDREVVWDDKGFVAIGTCATQFDVFLCADHDEAEGREDIHHIRT
jgi:hypothetical protein